MPLITHCWVRLRSATQFLTHKESKIAEMGNLDSSQGIQLRALLREQTQSPQKQTQVESTTVYKVYAKSGRVSLLTVSPPLPTPHPRVSPFSLSIPKGSEKNRKEMKAWWLDQTLLSSHDKVWMKEVSSMAMHCQPPPWPPLKSTGVSRSLTGESLLLPLVPALQSSSCGYGNQHY